MNGDTPTEAGGEGGDEAAKSPPPGAPWDLPIDEAPLCFVDLEMTGLDPAADHVVEVCIERWVGNTRVDAVNTLVYPPARVGGASHVHGLDEAALAGAPPFEAIASDVVRVLSGAVFVAHHATWDIKFLERELARTGHFVRIVHYLDTLVLSRRAFARASHALASLAEGFGIDPGKAHRAESDVRVLREVFARATNVLAPKSARDLWEVRVGERRARPAILEACELSARYAAPLSIAYRPSRKPTELMEFVVTEVRSDLDPPRVLGYQLPGRGRRELRADRILRAFPAGSPEPA